MRLKNGLIFFCGFLCAAALFAFTRNINVLEAIGLSVVITGTVLFIFAVLTLALFGLWVLWRIEGEGFASLNDALREAGFLPEKAR